MWSIINTVITQVDNNMKIVFFKDITNTWQVFSVLSTCMIIMERAIFMFCNVSVKFWDYVITQRGKLLPVIVLEYFAANMLGLMHEGFNDVDYMNPYIFCICQYWVFISQALFSDQNNN